MYLLKCTWTVHKNWSCSKVQKNISSVHKIEILQTIVSDHNAITLGIKNETKTNKQKSSSHRKLKDFLSNSSWVKVKIQTEITEFMKNNDHKNTVSQNLWDIFKAVITEKFIALNIYINKSERMVINELNF